MKLSYSTPSTIYIVTIAARIRNSSFDNDAWNARAAPWKRVWNDGGSPISFSAWSIAFTAAPSDEPGARLNETVVAGNWLKCVTSSGAGFSMNFAIDDSGTWPVVDLVEGR